ncbi:unnamed protein product [Cylindrotheca closterium]|uniref:CRAL-TRIO domain-containing protein n=1 Tax=Cylindrotheca closterium TaxID=2856 RepID=A0AAD2G466_9STRA|nr:unnamed protein product [Cylindrotheca closterium]
MTALMPKAFSLSKTTKRTSTKQRDISPTRRTSTFRTAKASVEVKRLVKESIEAARLRTEKDCVKGLRSYCDESSIKISDSLLFRFACFHEFDLQNAQEGIARSRDNEHYLNLKMNPGLQEFFHRRILYPLPGLVKTKTGDKMQAIYFRPSRFRAQDPAHHKYVIESLQYILNDLDRSHKESPAGVAVIINLKGYSNKNFHPHSMAKFLGSFEGKLVPTKVDLLIFVDAPDTFKPFMTFCKNVFSMDFSRKVHSIKSSKLSSFFMPGYEEYFPSELSGGWRDIEDDIDDYVDLKSYEDEMRTQEEISWQE